MRAKAHLTRLVNGQLNENENLPFGAATNQLESIRHLSKMYYELEIHEYRDLVTLD